MIVSDRARFIFIHNPKAGGTSVRRRLEPLDDSDPPFWRFAYARQLGRKVDLAHIPLEDLARAFPRVYAKLADYRSFAFVRNPYARTMSAFAEWCVYTGRKRHLGRPGWALPRFRDYVAALDPARVRANPMWIHACPQHQFVFRRDVQITARVGRAERLAKDYADIVAWIGITSPHPAWHNHSGRLIGGEDRRDWYDTASARRVAEFYAADFELFGYDPAAL